jgi:hypothetical protein
VTVDLDDPDTVQGLIGAFNRGPIEARDEVLGPMPPAR